MVISKKFVYSTAFLGVPKNSNFAILEEELPPIQEGEFLLETKYISIDLFVRYKPLSKLNIGDTIWALQIAKVIESKSSNYPVGRYIRGYYPCSTYNISDGTSYSNIPTSLIDEKYPLHKYLAVFGYSFATAYYGLTQHCQPKENEVIVITSAAGGVGHLVGQIGKILGCKVIGLTSKSEKCLWLKGLGFDHVLNYVTDDVSKELAKLAPKGIDCFFDNVGGELSYKIMENMRKLGRIAICGSTSCHNSDFVPKLPSIHPMISTKLLSITGFSTPMELEKLEHSTKTAMKWFEDGKLRTRETIIDGFENYPAALTSVYNGENLGKTIIKI
ncbi:prostaglandin reductase 1-like [Onthophagus taurus]|uniref:prostaglandin reductase 1-like n=1 Tax=Onthophagus taurus TaxID=166361 RepID=UPI0039BE14D3